jgi:hypothetical protein
LEIDDPQGTVNTDYKLIHTDSHNGNLLVSIFHKKVENVGNVLKVGLLNKIKNKTTFDFYDKDP